MTDQHEQSPGCDNGVQKDTSERSSDDDSKKGSSSSLSNIDAAAVALNKIKKQMEQQQQQSPLDDDGTNEKVVHNHSAAYDHSNPTVTKDAPTNTSVDSGARALNAIRKQVEEQQQQPSSSEKGEAANNDDDKAIQKKVGAIMRDFCSTLLTKSKLTNNDNNNNDQPDKEDADEPFEKEKNIDSGDSTESFNNVNKNGKENGKTPAVAIAAVLPPILQKLSKSSEDDDDDDPPDLAHQFQEHTYHTLTKCDMCTGLLVGLWSQGLQCQRCGVNVHRGEGKGDGHDDCRAEALLQPCPGDNSNSKTSNAISSSSKNDDDKNKESSFNDNPGLGETIKRVHEFIASESPSGFLEDVREQLDKDLMSHAKDYIISVGVEGERTKNLRRLREWLVLPVLTRMDQVEARGEVYSLSLLLGYHAIVATGVAVMGFFGFTIALWPRHGVLTHPAFRLALIHSSTVFGTFHVLLFLLSLVVRRGALAFKRKMIIFDQFLRDVFGIDAEMDIGISVAGAATRSKSWSDRIVWSSGISCCTAVLLWYAVQPLLPSAPLPLSSNNAESATRLHEPGFETCDTQ